MSARAAGNDHVCHLLDRVADVFDLDRLGQRIRIQQAETHALKTQLAALPKRVPLKTLVAEAEIVKLAPDAKHLTDAIKMVAYRAETALVSLLAPHYARTEDEGRALIREVLLSDADILPHPEQHRLVVRLHSLANPRSNAALAHLCETLKCARRDVPRY